MNLSSRNIAFKNDGIPRVSGMNLGKRGRYSVKLCIPRVSGDEPTPGTICSTNLWYSPRERDEPALNLVNSRFLSRIPRVSGMNPA